MDKCAACRYNTNDFVCHPHCGGCDGKSKYERGNFKLKGFNELAKAIHQNAVDHGWWEEERSIAEIIALCHSELSEALEEYRSGMPMVYQNCKVALSDGEEGLEAICAPEDCDNTWGECADCCEKPEGVVVELADCVIRILDYCLRRSIDIETALKSRRAGNDTYSLPELVAECHYLLSLAYKDAEPRSLYFAECINLIQFWCNENGGDLEEAIVIKHEYNKSRPYRHGGKKC